ncbi:MAG: hypothetical protein ACFB6S_12500 [Geminicoccaceae bacterium]
MARADLVEPFLYHRARAGRGAVERFVVQDDLAAVRGLLNVGFDHLGADIIRPVDRRDQFSASTISPSFHQLPRWATTMT